VQIHMKSHTNKHNALTLIVLFLYIYNNDTIVCKKLKSNENNCKPKVKS